MGGAPRGVRPHWQCCHFKHLRTVPAGPRNGRTREERTCMKRFERTVSARCDCYSLKTHRTTACAVDVPTPTTASSA